MDIWLLFDYTRKQLKDSKNSTKVLGILYLKLFNEDRFSRIGGLVKRFGPDVVLDAIIDLYFDEAPHFDKLKYYVKKNYNIKKEIEEQPEININLNDIIKERQANGK